MKHNINLIFNEKKDLEEIISSIIVREYLKKYEVDFTSGNISSLFSKLGISFDSVCQILLNQRVDNLNLMFNSSDNNIVSYKSL